MQIIQNIREKGTAIVIGVIALSLIGFILMDANLGSSRSKASGSNTIGKINGETIDSKEFTDKVKQIEDQYGGRVSGAQTYMIRQNAWDQLVAEKVLTAEFEKLGLIFSPKELSSIMFSNDAPQSLKQAFTDKTTGQYDIAKVQQWWQTAKKYKGEQRDAVESQVVEPIKLQSLYTKYSSLIAASGYYPTWMKEKETVESKTFATISYVAVPYAVIADSIVKVSDEEISDYVAKHKAMYKQEGGRQIGYIGFSVNPTRADTIKTFETVAALKNDFSKDTNAKVFVSRNMSSKDYKDEYVLKSKLSMAAKDSIAALATNTVYGPYLDGKDFVLAKMLSSRQLADSVKCRHILIQTKDPQTGQITLADSIAKKRIDSIETAIKGGEDFNKMVLKYSDDQGSKQKAGEYDFSSSQFITLAREFSETIFYGVAGDKKVVHTDFGWHYIEVISQKNFEPAYKLAYVAKEIVASDETVNSASAKANILSGEARDAKAVDAYVAKNGLQKIDVPTVVKENDYQLGALQDARQLIRWAFEAKQGDVSEPFSIGDQFVVAVLNKVQPEGLPDAKTARPMVETAIKNQKKAAQIKTKLTTTATLESASAAYNLQIATAGADSSLTFGAQIINGVGQEPKVIGASFNKANQAKVSEPIAGNNAVYVLKINSIGNKPAATPEEVAKQASDRSRTLAQQINSGWFESLKKLATIKDDRSKTN
jgi:peptidyl-prolyl cis-trans isomerase D